MLALDRWTRAERAALVRLVRAKAAESERDYVRAFAELPRLEAALARLGRARPRRYAFGLNGLPSDAGMFRRIQRGLREMSASTRIVAR